MDSASATQKVWTNNLWKGSRSFTLYQHSCVGRITLHLLLLTSLGFSIASVDLSSALCRWGCMFRCCTMACRSSFSLVSWNQWKTTVKQSTTVTLPLLSFIILVYLTSSVKPELSDANLSWNNLSDGNCHHKCTREETSDAPF